MNQKIDCLLIGHNQVKFTEYEAELRAMGTDSGAYRDLYVNFLEYDNKKYNAADMYNLFCIHNGQHSGETGPALLPLAGVETFSAAISYLGTYLQRRGFRFDFVNSFQEEKDYLADLLANREITAIAILTTLYVSPSPLLEIMDFIRRYNTAAKIIVGGPFVATRVRTLDHMELQHMFRLIGADVYVNSPQGEKALVDTLDSFENKKTPDHVYNIYYKNGTQYIATALKAEDNRLEENMVDWSLFSGRIGEYVNVRSAISCPFSCSFCGFPQHAGQYQVTSVEALERELDQLARFPSLRRITFIDDTFNVPPERFKKILRMMVNKRYPFKWNSFYRCQYADKETIALMKESGCDCVFLGIESANDQILRNMNKKTTVEKYYRGVELLKEYGITTFGNFVIGFPGETESTIEDSIRFIRTSGIDFYRAQMWYGEPITPIYREKEKYGISGESFQWSHATMNSVEANGWVEKMLLEIDTPTRYPQYYFDYDKAMMMTYKGVEIEGVKRFLDAFNEGIREKLTHSGNKEVSFEILNRISQSCRSGAAPQKEPTAASPEEEDMAEFDF